NARGHAAPPIKHERLAADAGVHGVERVADVRSLGAALRPARDHDADLGRAGGHRGVGAEVRSGAGVGGPVAVLHVTVRVVALQPSVPPLRPRAGDELPYLVVLVVALA